MAVPSAVRGADGLHEYKGVRASLPQLACQMGQREETVRARLAKGWSLVRALEAAPDRRAHNKARAAVYAFRGEEHTLPEWARIVGIPYRTLWIRLKDGWSLESALTTSVEIRVQYQGQTKPLRALAEAVGLSYDLVYHRIHVYGWPVERALSTPAERSARELRQGLLNTEKELLDRLRPARQPAKEKY